MAKHGDNKNPSGNINPSQGGAHRKPMRFQFVKKSDGTQDLMEFADEEAAQAFFNRKIHVYVTFSKL